MRVVLPEAELQYRLTAVMFWIMMQFDFGGKHCIKPCRFRLIPV